jgi:photosystem II stability/assembly factor-like uncharacterized protein
MANRAAQIAAALVVLATTAGDLPASAPDLRPELDPTGRIDDLAISPSGQLWFGTATGHAYASFDLNRSWQEVAVTARRDDPGPPYSWDTDQLGRFRFFDEHRGLVVGYIGKAKDTVYRTSDGGRTWSTVLLPSSLWVYDAQATAAGLVWLVGSTGEVLHSEDFGLTWRALASPFDSSSRSHSVHFDSPQHGVVGALSDALAVTSDGGRNWRTIASPAQQGLTGECVPDGRFEKVRLLGERLVVEQCGAVYAALAEPKPAWSELRAGTRPLLDFELHPDGLVAVAADREIVFFDHGLAAVQPTGYALGAAPTSIAVEGNRIAILENDGKVTVGEGREFRSSRMFGQGVAQTWPIVDFDRGADGALWGVSRFFVYRSEDAGRTWHRRVELPVAVVGCALTAAGDLLLWDSHGWVARWSPESGVVRADPTLDGLDVVGLFRRGRLWLVYGGMQYETTRRIEVARTYFGGQFAGSVDYGFVAASVDGGVHWTVVDRWPDGGVQALFLGEDDTLTLLSYLCAVRRGPLVVNGPGAPEARLETVLPATESTRRRVPYVERAFLIEFLAGRKGWVTGWTHHLGNFAFRSTDGGRSWRQEPFEERPYEKLERLGGGTWAAIENRRVLTWSDGRFVPSKRFDVPIRWTRIDAAGALLVEDADRALWSLSADGATWRQLR